MASPFIHSFCAPEQFSGKALESDFALHGFTPCFEDVVILGVIHLTMTFFAIVRLIQICSSTKKKERVVYALGWDRFVHILKAMLCVVNCVIPLLQLNGQLGVASAISKSLQIQPFEIVAITMASIAWLFVSLAVIVEFRGLTRAGTWIMRFLFCFAWAGMSIKAYFTIKLRMEAVKHVEEYFFFLFIFHYASICLLALIAITHWPSKYRQVIMVARTPDDPNSRGSEMQVFEEQYVSLTEDTPGRGAFDHRDATERPKCPEDRANIISRVTFGWMTPILRKGYKKPLEADDLWDVNTRDQADPLFNKFSKAWAVEKKKKKPSLARVLFKLHLTPLITSAVFKVINDLSQFVGPLLLQRMIQFVKNGNEAWWVGILYALGLFLGPFVGALAEGQVFQRLMRIGMNWRSTIITAVFRKSMTLDQRNSGVSTGKMTNLMSSDAESLQNLCTNIHSIWSSPLRIVIALVMMWFQVGLATIAAILILVCMIPIQKKLVGWAAMLLRRSLQSTDQRLNIINEVLGAMSVVKCYAWEESFEKKVTEVRNIELNWLTKSAYLRATNTFIIQSIPPVVAMATFIAFVLIPGSDLSPSIAFTTISLLGVLQGPLFMLPQIITDLTNATVSFDRLSKLLLSDDVEDSSEPLPILANTPVVEVKQGNFVWDKDSSTPTLKGIDIAINEGSLVTIIGGTGSGKSSFLSALLSEMPTASSATSVTLRGRISYVSQQSWIFNATIRENILFGQPFEEGRYARAVEAASLGRDLELLPAGDQTEIGEKGVNLSGGQKQRVSIARAAYADADVVLMDDPLSALDAHVARDVYEKCIRGLMRTKTVVLVTNRVEFVEESDTIIMMEKGSIGSMGQYEQLMRTSAPFQRLMNEVAPKDTDEQEDEKPAAQSPQKDKKSKKPKEQKPQEYEPEDKPAASLKRQGTGKKLLDAGKATKKEDSKEKVKKEQQGQLIKQETMERGSLSIGVFIYYIRAMGGWFPFFMITSFYIVGEVARNLSTFWMSAWSVNKYGNRPLIFYLGIYIALSVANVLLSLLQQMSLAGVGIKAARTMHARMLSCLMHVPMAFFNSTPFGRIINRFTKDMADIDKMLIMSLSMFVRTVVQLIGTLIMLSTISNYLLAVFVPVLCMFYWTQRYFQASSREMKRLDAVTRSPIYAHFGQCLNGITTIRAYRAEQAMNAESTRKVDDHIRFNLAQMSSNRWLTVRLEVLGGVVVFSSAALALVSRDVLGPDLVGLALTYALQITSLLNMLTRVSSVAENAFNSVERVQEYSQLDQEAPAVIEDKRPHKGWPENGRLEFNGVQASYREDLPPVLRGLSFSVEPREKIGVVGRTGAGKSSLFLALFRIIELMHGSVVLDGLNLSEMGLRDVRNAISIIPQEPVLFSGTIRFNLDPFNEHSDAKVWDSLERSHLRAFVESQPGQLEMLVTDNGDNFSVGQRQLLCLARALLRHSKVLVLDEATAAVDVETDSLIQNTIRTEFADCTMLTIAHRLNTIIDSDKILVLDAGQALEFDTPKRLLERDTVFAGMVDNTGKETAAFLRSIARGDVNYKESLKDAMTMVDVDTIVQGPETAVTSALLSGEDFLNIPWRSPRLQEVSEAIISLREALSSLSGPQWQNELRNAGLDSGDFAKQVNHLLVSLSLEAEKHMGSGATMNARSILRDETDLCSSSLGGR